MRLLLVTIFDVNNYGATFQAYASARFLGKIKEVNIINMQNNYLDLSSKVIRYNFSPRGFLRSAKDIFRLKPRYELTKKFKKFNEQYLPLTKRFNKITDIVDILNPEDILIVGSDQLWNPRVVSGNNGFEDLYFLDFAKENKKMTMATSVGGYQFNSTEKNILREKLETFSYITVREETTAELFRKEVREDVECIIDPTLLISKEEWEEISSNMNHLKKEDFLIVYALRPDKKFMKIVDHISKKYNLKVVSIDQEPFANYKTDFHCKNAGPEDFLYYFLNASFVITNSFHGTAFSINFHKNFVTITPEHGAERVENLLKRFDLSNRMIENENDLKNLNLEINFNTINTQLENIRTETFNKMRAAILCSRDRQ